MTECKRHKPGAVDKFRVVHDQALRVWAVVEFRLCARCGSAMDGRVAKGAIKRDRVEAMVAYGCTVDEIAEYTKAHWPELAAGEHIAARPSSEPIAVPLTSCPFKVSAHTEST